MDTIRKTAILLSLMWWILSGFISAASFLVGLQPMTGYLLDAFALFVTTLLATHFFIEKKSRIMEVSEIWQLSWICSIIYGLLSLISITVFATIIVHLTESPYARSLKDTYPSKSGISIGEMIFTYAGAIVLTAILTRVALGFWNKVYPWLRKWPPIIKYLAGLLFLVIIGLSILYEGSSDIQRAAEQGDASAQNYLGMAYETGDGLTQDYAKAASWYRKAAEQGLADAQSNLGSMYVHGRGVQQNYVEAVKLFREAAEQGNAKGQHNLGVMYNNGFGVPQDYKRAVFWYRKATDQGLANAQSNLGVCYRDGEGVPEDAQEAIKWMRRAAEQGYVFAQFNLGVMYDSHGGIPQDIDKSIKWYREASQQGYAKAQNNLGLLYAKGNGVAQDFKEAYAWFDAAAEQGVEMALRNRNTVADRLTPSELSKAQSLSREYQEKYVFPFQ